MHQTLERDSAATAVQQILAETQSGRMVILVDDIGRTGGGDLVLAAEHVTAQAVNAMASLARGLICLALTESRADALGLCALPVRNRGGERVAFTQSIEARDGITTGISAADRARTIRIAQDARFGADDIATPGHVFPIRVSDGGVIVRAGLAEAAVDACRLAGLTPAAVTCRILDAGGNLAGCDDLEALARREGFAIGTLSDLVAYRRRHDPL